MGREDVWKEKEGVVGENVRWEGKGVV